MGGLMGLCHPTPPFWYIYIFYKNKVYEQKKLVLNKYEICLKMMEMAIFDSNFQIFLGEHAPRPP